MTTLAVMALVLLVLIAVGIVGAKSRSRPLKEKPKARMPLTKYEQPMYFRLRETFPDEVVLAQVAFSALLKSKSRSTRNAFNQKVADFVVCTKAFEVLAVIELDDSSHADKKEADAASDELLEGAGYRVLRYSRAPDAATLKTAIDEAKAAVSCA
jgi:very-short-patch-repair endonuclease